MRYNSLNFYFALAAIFISAAANAQQVPNISDVLHGSQLPNVPTQNTPSIPNIGGVTIELPMKSFPNGQATLVVKNFNIVGNQFIDNETLLKKISSSQGKKLSLAELEDLAAQLTRYYRTNGYFVARVYIPAQKVENGEVTLRVVEGNYGRFHLKNKSMVRDEIVQSIIDDIKDKNIVSLNKLERAMLIINDTPGSKVTQVDVMPGEKLGTSDFAIITEATSAYNGFIMLDNFGTRYTGRNRVSFSNDFNSLTKNGDRLSISGLATREGSILNGRIAYNALLMPNGLRGEVALSNTNYQLASSYKNLDAIGYATTIDGGFTYPIIKTTAQSLETNLNFAYKDLMDKIRSTNTHTPKTAVVANMGLTFRDERSFFGLNGLNIVNVGMSFGHVSIHDKDARKLDAAGAKTAGEFSKFVASLSRTTALPLEFSLALSVRYQQSLQNKNLDGSERMSVSGQNNVLAYPSGELSGSNATFARAELSRSLFSYYDVKTSASVFTEWGQAKAANPISITDRNRDLNDIGVGLNATYKSALLKGYFAHRLDSKRPTSETYPKNKFLLQVGWVW